MNTVLVTTEWNFIVYFLLCKTASCCD